MHSPNSFCCMVQANILVRKAVPVPRTWRKKAGGRGQGAGRGKEGRRDEGTGAGKREGHKEGEGVSALRLEGFLP